MPPRRRARDWVSLPFTEAIRDLRNRVPLTPDEFAALELWARGRAFRVAGVSRLDVLQDVIESLAETVRSGGTLADFRRTLDDVFESAGLDPLEPWHAETVFRTNVQQAYGRGLWDQMNEVRDETWGWRYHSVGDDRVRDEHSALDGKAFRLGDGDGFFPPWGFNCRCDAEWLSLADAEAEGLEDSDLPTREAQEELLSSDFASPAIREDPPDIDLASYHPRLAAEYLRDHAAERLGR